MIKCFFIIAIKNLIRNKTKNILYLLLISFVVLSGLYSLEVYSSITATNTFIKESLSAQSDHDTNSMFIFVSRVSFSLLIISATLLSIGLFVFCQNKLSEDKIDLAVLRAIGYKNVHLLIINLLENGILNVTGYIFGALLSSAIFLSTQHYIKTMFNIELPFLISPYFVVLLFQITLLLVCNLITTVQFKLSPPITILKE